MSFERAPFSEPSSDNLPADNSLEVVGEHLHTKKELRIFSQTHFQDDRIALARHIKEMRASYRTNITHLDSAVASIDFHLQEEYLLVERVLSDIERLENDLARAGGIFFHSLTSFFERASIQKRIASYKTVLERTQSIIEFQEGQKAFFQERSLLNRDATTIRGELRSFYAAQSREYDSFELLKQATSVASFTDRYDGYA
jgi:hypothetical protein